MARSAHQHPGAARVDDARGAVRRVVPAGRRPRTWRGDRCSTSFGPVVLQPYPGGEVGDVAQSSLPYVLAGLLVVLALGALLVILVGSVRRHRRLPRGADDHGLRRPPDLRHGGVAGGGAGRDRVLAVGVPAGLVLGRWAWQVVAGSVGSVSPVVVPGLATLVVAAATVAVAGGMAFGPGWVGGTRAAGRGAAGGIARVRPGSRGIGSSAESYAPSRHALCTSRWVIYGEDR